MVKLETSIKTPYKPHNGQQPSTINQVKNYSDLENSKRQRIKKFDLTTPKTILYLNKFRTVSSNTNIVQNNLI
jgi:hypothetical protein